MKIQVNNEEKKILSIVYNFVKPKLSKEDEIKVWMDIAALCLKDIDFLIKMLYSVRTQQSISNESKDIEYIYKDEKNVFKVASNNPKEFDLQLADTLISGIISALEKILPIGTVVKLKKTYMEALLEILRKNEEYEKKYKEQIEKEGINDICIIINKRFAKTEIEGVYAHYSGYIYPLSQKEKNVQFIFSNEDINEIMHKGYINEAEKEYVCLLKYQALVEKNYLSISTKEEIIKDKKNNIKLGKE